MRSLFVQFSPVLLSLAFAACGSETRVDTDAAVETTVVAASAVDAVTGFVDPACKMKVAENAPITLTHEGVTYGFCGKGCKAAFAAEPASFLAALEE